MFGPFVGFDGPSGARKGSKIILSHVASSCFNMNPYPDIWTHEPLLNFNLICFPTIENPVQEGFTGFTYSLHI